jgi:hypothetical protein
LREAHYIGEDHVYGQAVAGLALGLSSGEAGYDPERQCPSLLHTHSHSRHAQGEVEEVVGVVKVVLVEVGFKIREDGEWKERKRRWRMKGEEEEMENVKRGREDGEWKGMKRRWRTKREEEEMEM